MAGRKHTCKRETVYLSANAALPSTTLPWGLSEASNHSWETGDKLTRWQGPWRMWLLQHSCVWSQGSWWPTRAIGSKDMAFNSALEGRFEWLTSIAVVQPPTANALSLQRVPALVCKLLRMSFSSSLMIRVFPSSSSILQGIRSLIYSTSNKNVLASETSLKHRPMDVLWAMSGCSSISDMDCDSLWVHVFTFWKPEEHVKFWVDQLSFLNYDNKW